MKRSDFLALIPAISSIPLIGKEIVQKSDRIEIYQPEEVKDYATNNDAELRVYVCRGDFVVGTMEPRTCSVSIEPVDYEYGLGRIVREGYTMEVRGRMLPIEARNFMDAWHRTR